MWFLYARSGMSLSPRGLRGEVGVSGSGCCYRLGTEFIVGVGAV